MTPFHTGKEKISLEEIRNILKSNLNMYMSIYKDDPDFIDYFIDLTLYLIRYKYDRADDVFGDNSISDTELPEPERRVLQSGTLNNQQPIASDYCHFCGAQLKGKRKCPDCGNINV